MTTIVFRDGVLAADRLVTRCELLYASKTKILKVNGGLASACGSAPICENFIGWVQAGCPKVDFSELMNLRIGNDEYDAVGIIITPQRIHTFSEAGMVSCDPGPAAWGSGADFAYGAMSMGASAEQAVAAAAEWDTATGHGIDTIRFDD